MNANEKIDFETSTIGEIVAQDYRKATVFKKYGLDFCCGGNKSIDKACQEKQLNPNQLKSDLHALDSNMQHADDTYNRWELDKLIDHILKVHHTYVQEAMPILSEFSTKVAKVHGDHSPEVIKINQIFQGVREELEMHLIKEEKVLFPYILEMLKQDRESKELVKPHFGSAQNPIRLMEIEHESAGGAMLAIRELSNDFTPPEWACNTYKALYGLLHDFELDLHKHVHLENNILFPKAVELESKLFRN